jgi:hypothetical protein
MLTALQTPAHHMRRLPISQHATEQHMTSVTLTAAAAAADTAAAAIAITTAAAPPL